MASNNRITVDTLSQMEDDRWIEVIDGRIAGRDMRTSSIRTHITANLYNILRPSVKARKLGYVRAGLLTFLLAVDGDTVKTALIPSLAFIRTHKLPQGYDFRRPFPGAPDLAVEVVTPAHTADGLLQRVHLYRNAGTEQVWVIYPTQREVHVYYREIPQTVHVYRRGDLFEANNLSPGVTIAVDDLFIGQD